jgi:hypothetical protein
VRTEKTKAKPAVSEAALQAARLRKFQAEAILRTIAAAERSGEVVPLKGVCDLLSMMIHRCRAKLLRWRTGVTNGLIAWCIPWLPEAKEPENF